MQPWRSWASIPPSRQRRPRDPPMVGLPWASLVRCSSNDSLSGLPQGRVLVCRQLGSLRPWQSPGMLLPRSAHAPAHVGSSPADAAKAVSRGQHGLPAATSVWRDEGHVLRRSRAPHAATARRERVANLLREGQSLCVGDTVRRSCQPLPRRRGQQVAHCPPVMLPTDLQMHSARWGPKLLGLGHRLTAAVRATGFAAGTCSAAKRSPRYGRASPRRRWRLSSPQTC